MSRHRAYFILGGQGAGKTNKAVEAAKRLGQFTTVQWEDFDSQLPFALSTLVLTEVKSIIVNDCPLSALTDDRVKSISTAEQIRLNAKGVEPQTVDNVERWFFTITVEGLSEVSVLNLT